MTFLTETIWTSSLLILAVLALRAVLGTHVSARLRYGLWLLPALRLYIPVSVQQAMHLMPQSRLSVVSLPRSAAAQAPAPVQPLLDNLQTGRVYAFDNPTPAQAAASIDWQLVLFVLWLLGAAAVTVWCVMVNRRFAKNLAVACEYRGISRENLPVYVARNLRSPCLYALYGKPGIYVPQAVADNPERLRHVLAHEDAHFRQHDLIWSVVRTGLLALYWFHPLVWVMAFLSRRDCEQACDEAAIRALGEDERLAYGRTLVGLMAAGRPGDLVCGATTMTDSKKGVRERVRCIAERPQTRAASVFLLVACVVLSMAFTFTASTTHQKACTMLRQSPPVSAYSFFSVNVTQTYTALSDEEIDEAVELFLRIRDTMERPEIDVETTPEWILDFTLPDGADGKRQHLSLDMLDMESMLVHLEQSGEEMSYLVREPDTVLAFRKLVGLSHVRIETISVEQGTFRLHNSDPDHTYTFAGLGYTLVNLTTGDGQGVSASQAASQEPKRLEPGWALDWAAPGWSVPTNGLWRLTVDVTRDDGEALEISTIFAVGEPDDSSASEAFYKGWPLVSGTPLTADDVRDLARRGDTVRTSDFSRFLWEMPDNSSVDYMQFPVYDRMEFGTDTGLYVTMASGGSDTPSSVALYAPDGT
ncbi:MAG: M56 family metallopeptidase, partial [Butyricicoccus sp.]